MSFLSSSLPLRNSLQKRSRLCMLGMGSLWFLALVGISSVMIEAVAKLWGAFLTDTGKPKNWMELAMKNWKFL
uniref:Uncharacterized protein n=1 Tax=Rhizophora mucronata TaxID=61149 RepID=A0A2P2J6V2_RHIMU